MFVASEKFAGEAAIGYSKNWMVNTKHETESVVP